MVEALSVARLADSECPAAAAMAVEALSVARLPSWDPESAAALASADRFAALVEEALSADRLDDSELSPPAANELAIRFPFADLILEALFAQAALRLDSERMTPMLIHLSHSRIAGRLKKQGLTTMPSSS